MQDAYLVDCGYLIFEGEEFFESYNEVYDKKYGYCDDDGQYYMLDRDKAIHDAEEYLSEGGERAYAIVSDTWLDDDITEQTFEEEFVDVEGETYSVESVIFGKAIIDGQIVDLFK